MSNAKKPDDIKRDVEEIEKFADSIKNLSPDQLVYEYLSPSNHSVIRPNLQIYRDTFKFLKRSFEPHLKDYINWLPMDDSSFYNRDFNQDILAFCRLIRNSISHVAENFYDECERKYQ